MRTHLDGHGRTESKFFYLSDIPHILDIKTDAGMKGTTMENKYDYLFNESMPIINDGEMSSEGSAAGLEPPANLGEGMWLMHSKMVPESQINMTHIWIKECVEPQHWVDPHIHDDYDEILIWTGGDPENPHDLGAEIYMEIEGERHIITTSGCVYIPAGTTHCPLGFNRVDRPFRFSALSLAPSYKSRPMKNQSH